MEKGTAGKIAEEAGMNVQTVRNILLKLREKGLVKPLGGMGYKLLTDTVIASIDVEKRGKEKVYVLAKEFDEIFNEHREDFEKWARTLGVDPKKLRQIIEDRKRKRKEQQGV